jgi:hypothetical protein
MGAVQDEKKAMATKLTVNRAIGARQTTAAATVPSQHSHDNTASTRVCEKSE